MLSFSNGWKVYFCRHGQTQMNSSGQLQGKNNDTQLNEMGHAQADRLGAFLRHHFGAKNQTFVLVNGPLLRAHQTAEHVHAHCMALCDWHHQSPIKEFNEIDFGDTPHHSSKAEAMRIMRPIREAWSRGVIDAKKLSKSAESLRDILTRFISGLTRLYHRCHNGQVPGVVVTHSGFLSIIMAAAVHAHGQMSISRRPCPDAHWLSDPTPWGLENDMPYRIDNCSVSQLAFDPLVDSSGHHIHFALYAAPLANYVNHLEGLAHAHTISPVANGHPNVHAYGAQYVRNRAVHPTNSGWRAWPTYPLDARPVNPWP
jgi:broad specificity phosphatase PhoE